MTTSGCKLVAALSLGFCLCVSSSPARAQEDDQLHPVDDVAGVLVADPSPEKPGTLYTTYDDEKQVLEALHARETGRDTYATSITGSVIHFAIIRRILPGLFLPDASLICQTPFVKVYRNATCVPTLSGTLPFCAPYTGGNYATMAYNVTKKCKVGTGFCVEVNQVSWTRNIYFNSQCTQLIGSQSGFDFMCN
jgi:hypothetical protein